MTGERNDNPPHSVKSLRTAAALFDFAYRIKSHQIRRKHPEWTSEEIHRETMALIIKGCAS